jgi:hypothetical protein
LAEIGAEPVSGFYLRPGAERLIERAEAVGEYPAPSVSSRDLCEPVAWPRPVVLLSGVATQLDWEVVLAYAKGCMPHATTGAPGDERESYSVRFAKDGYQGYAIYAGKAWQSIMVTGRDLPPFGKLGRTDLGAWLREPWPGGDPRYDEIRQRVAQRTERAKVRAVERPKRGRGEAL